MIDSVKSIDKSEAAAAKARNAYNKQAEKDAPVVNAVIEAIGQGVNTKTEMIKHIYDTTGISKPKIIKVLTDYEGTNNLKHRWRMFTGAKNAKSYTLINVSAPSASDYMRAKYCEY